jgi:twitching motility protein PilT
MTVVGFPELLDALLARRGSDLHLHSGAVPAVRVDGRLEALSAQPVHPELVAAIIASVLSPARAATWEATGEALAAVDVPGKGRFRVHAQHAFDGPGLVVRRIDAVPPTLDELGLPAALGTLAESPRGLVLIGGPGGSGRSATVAAMVQHLNQRRVAVAVTLEDPVEVRHVPGRALVVQREVGSGPGEVAAALRATRHHDADVVVVGSLDDADALRTALALAGGTQLVIGVLSAVTVAGAMDQVLAAFPPDAAAQARARGELAGALRGVCCQRLLQRTDGRGRVVACELLVNSPRVGEAIAEPNRVGVPTLEQAMADGGYHGMQTLDQALLRLVGEGLVARTSALAAASRPHELGIALQAAGLSQL